MPSNGHSPWFRILRYLGQASIFSAFRGMSLTCASSHRRSNLPEVWEHLRISPPFSTGMSSIVAARNVSLENLWLPRCHRKLTRSRYSLGMQLALEFDEAGAQSFSTLEIAYQLVKLIGDTEELKTLQRRHLIGGIQAQATLIKTVENSIHAAREHLDRIRASVHNVGDSVRTALVFRDQTVVHTLWSKHASEVSLVLQTVTRNRRSHSTHSSFRLS